MNMFSRHRENRIDLFFLLIILTILSIVLSFPSNRIHSNLNSISKFSQSSSIHRIRNLNRWMATPVSGSDGTEGFQPVIAPYLKLPGMLTEKRKTQPFQSSLDYNWISGMCKHKQVFEATETIRRVQFAGDLVAFAMTDGKVSVVRMSTGDILDKFSGHKSDISSLYFDGINLLSGGGDGKLNVYNVTYDNPRELGSLVKQHHMHAGMITGIKLLRSVVNEKETCSVVTCGADRKLTGFNLDTGVVQFTTLLTSNPLCMDVQNNYICLGLQDGRVVFFSGTTGKQILQFQAHSSRVQCIHFVSDDLVITGGQDGTVRRWDITGERSASPKASRVIDFFFRDALINEYANDQFHAKENFIKDLPTGSFRVYRKDDGGVVPVVALQGDDRKIVAAYQDGVVRIWDTVSCTLWFEMRGRAPQITSVQYDATRLVVDGTYTVLMVHDFTMTAKAPGKDFKYKFPDNSAPL